MSTGSEEETPASQGVTVAPGEGERRAQRGYITQYDLAARLIFAAIASGRLKWVGLADRGAGTFDDVVLGLRDRIAAFQVKTSRDPEPFTIRTVLLGAQNLLGKMLESRRKLVADHPDTLIETTYACDDYPRPDDDVGGSISSAAFLRAHEAHRLSWSLAEWKASASRALVADVQAASGLDDESFAVFWRHTRFVVGGQGRFLEVGPPNPRDDRRVRELAAELPRMVADLADRDRWSVTDLLARLGWRDPFELRHGHSFPVDAFYQANAPTQRALQDVLATITSGYVSLVGPPGCGKSTILAAGLLPTPRAVILRYLAFVPDEGQGLGRGEAVDFLHDLVKQFKQQGLGQRIMPGTEITELVHQLEFAFGEASERFLKEGVRSVVVVDGLDHVPREERPQHSFLRQLPLPHAVPSGVVFVLGTQRLDLTDMPPAVRDQAKEPQRRVDVTPLPREAVARLADAAGVPGDVDRQELFARTDGHALSTRYLIGGLLAAQTPDARRDWLRNGPAYGGDVEVFYERAWRELESNLEAQRALAYVALAEGPIRAVSLDGIVGPQATDSAWNQAGHLLVRDRRNAWSIFHNSFRLFLRAHTGLRHGLADGAMLKRRYEELAAMASTAEDDDPQRWLELRYRARAGNHTAVANLARAERFRRQFVEGRNPGEIFGDLGMAFAAAGQLRNPELVLELILARHEIAMRAYALGDDVFDALIALGKRPEALGLLKAEGVSLGAGKGFELIDAFLEANEVDEAQKLFEAIEPINILLGAEEIADRPGETDIVAEWAERALIYRPPEQFLASLARLRAPDERRGREFDMEVYQTQLKLAASRGQLRRHPESSPEALMRDLQLAQEERDVVLYQAAWAAFNVGDENLALERLQDLEVIASDLGPSFRRDLARLALGIGRADLAAAFFEGVSAPTLANRNFGYGGEDLKWVSRQIIAHAMLSARQKRHADAGRESESPLWATFQRRLERLGRLLGEGRVGATPSIEPKQEFRELLTFLEHAASDDPHGSERWALDGVMEEVVAAVVAASAALGADVLASVAEEMDARLTARRCRLGRASIRRTYAVELFKHDGDSAAAKRRVGYRAGMEASPGEQMAEAARTAQVYVELGLVEEANAILVEMHTDGLGISRPPKKDPQYIFWRDLFVLACDEDSGRRTDRLRFLGRFITGMAETEGSDAAHRMAPSFLEQAAQAGPAWASRAVDLCAQGALVSWSELVAGVLRGVVQRNRDLAAAVGVIFGRVALPFADEDDESIYEFLIERAPEDQLENVLRHAVECLGMDCRSTKRITRLENAIEAASDRGLRPDRESVERWRRELPRPKSGSSPEDPFFLVKTLDEMVETLREVGTGTGSWGVVRAFTRLAARARYENLKQVFDDQEVLNRDERAIEVVAKAAIAAGRRVDAVACLARLGKLAGDQGGWGEGWREKTKQRYHQLNVALNGETAGRAAFDAFVDDLANRREPLDALLPDLCDVFEVLSPRPAWASAWECLERQLTQFREHRLGTEFPCPTDPIEGDHDTLADVLFRAIETNVIELARMAKAAAVELTSVRGGSSVVAALVPRLWRSGGHLALEAAHISWECRDAAEVRERVVAVLDEMLFSEDAVIRQNAASLAQVWNLELPAEKARELPAIYRLALPDSPLTESFEPPAGTSTTSSGLYTEDAYSWTWPLGEPLKMTAEATGLGLAQLRARAAQFMSRLGGTAAFGPDRAAEKKRHLSRLKLFLTYRKLEVAAAFQAGREVIGELLAAGALDQSHLPWLVAHLAGFPSGVATLPPEPRPAGVPAPEFNDHLAPGTNADWREAVEQDLIAPTVAGHLVLAASALHERGRFREVWQVEQYYGPGTEVAEEDLPARLRRLPRVLVMDRSYPRYRAVAPGAVVHAEPDLLGTIEPFTLALCPRVAEKLGWQPTPRNALTYLDPSGQVAARTVSWRDGGICTVGTDTTIFRRGCLLIVREDRVDDLRPYLGAEWVSKAWRMTQAADGDDKVASRAAKLAGNPTT